MGKKLTLEYVKQYFKDHKCELLEEEYKRAVAPMKYKCNCGNISKITFSKFQQGQRCKKCSGNEKLTLKYVKQYFKDQGCELLEEYINDKTKIKYKCNCGDINEIIFSKFKGGQRCWKCRNKKIGNKKRFSYKYVYNYFKNNNCELLEEQYMNGSTKMRYKCKCGNASKIRFDNFRKGERCLKCGGSEKYTYKYVYDYFKSQGCSLLDNIYINGKTPIKYRCVCGNVSKMRFSHFKKGHRCRLCFNRGFSKESQRLFNSIYEKTKRKKRTFFATLNHEFGIRFQDKYFKYDYVNSILKKAIEYNGSAFHPQEHQNDDETGWFVLDGKKTVKEARGYEKIKYEGLEKQGYKILTVWDYEMHKNFDSLVQKCFDFLIS